MSYLLTRQKEVMDKKHMSICCPHPKNIFLLDTVSFHGHLCFAVVLYQNSVATAAQASCESHRCRKKNLFALGTALYFNYRSFASPVHQLDNTDIKYFLFSFKQSQEMRKTVIKSNRLKGMNTYLRGHLGSYQLYVVIEGGFHPWKNAFFFFHM